MPPNLAKISDEEKRYQQQQQNERELASLRKEYDILDREQARTQITGFRKLTKASKVIEIFRKEYENVLIDLRVAESPGNIKREDTQFDQLSTRLLEYDYYKELVKTYKTYIEEVDQQIRKEKKEVQSLQKQQISDRQYEDHVKNAVQILETLENKLDAQIKSFNMIVTKNAKLRQEIDHLLKDRQNFITMFEKLIDKLNTGKRYMLDLIEQATIAYDQREEWCNRLQMLRMKGHKDFLYNIEQRRHYDTRIMKAKNLEDFFTTKGKKRVLKDLIEKECLKRKNTATKLGEKLQLYRNMLNDIKSFMKQTKIDVIAKFYYRQEAQNFTNFNMILDMIKEMEVINDDLIFRQFKVEEEKSLQDYRSNQQKETLAGLEKQLEEWLKTTRDAEAELESQNLKLKQMMDGIQTIFKLCKCDQDPLLKILGDNSTVKDYNVLMYLEVLESTIHDLLIAAGYQAQATSDKKSREKKILHPDHSSLNIYGIDKIVESHPCVLCVVHEMVSDITDTVQHPWSRQKAKEKLEQRLCLPGAHGAIHTVSKCHLPAARRLMQQRYE